MPILVGDGPAVAAVRRVIDPGQPAVEARAENAGRQGVKSVDVHEEQVGGTGDRVGPPGGATVTRSADPSVSARGPADEFARGVQTPELGVGSALLSEPLRVQRDGSGDADRYGGDTQEHARSHHVLANSSRRMA